MERKGKSRYGASLLFLSLCALAVLIGASSVGTAPGEQSRPAPARFGETRLAEPAERAPAGVGEPARIEELQAAVQRAAALARDEDWPKAEEAAREIRERWVSFKPAMRANAGERMWQSSDMNDFEAALDRFRQHAAARDRTKALEETEIMLEIIDGYTDDRDRLSARSDGNTFTSDPSPMP